MAINVIWNAPGINDSRAIPFHVTQTGIHLLIVSGSAMARRNDSPMNINIRIVTRGNVNPVVGTLTAFVNAGPRWHQSLLTVHIPLELRRTEMGNPHTIELIPDDNTEIDQYCHFNVVLLENVGPLTPRAA